MVERPMSATAFSSHMAITQALAEALRLCCSRGALCTAALSVSGPRVRRLPPESRAHSSMPNSPADPSPMLTGVLKADIKEPNITTHNIMMDGCAKLGNLGDAAELFDRMPTRDVASWNTLMSGYLAGLFLNGTETFVSMH
ncbi:hypothetical protein ABZP36_003220 [Zizania latifolia]